MNTLFSQSFYDLSLKDLSGKELKMSQFKGHYVLIVNVASFCGYTSQYKDLQKLHQQYDQLTVIGVPCNQFGSQEPGSADEIQAFCDRNYQIDFPMTEKIEVKGKGQHSLYSWLTQKSKNGLGDFKVSWNFNKFLIGPDGKLLAHFASGVKPLDQSILNFIK